ncbi:MAG: bifunctional demethylmenaquinone methyltransferase/2-methoxy-6-polyprenyl-1,4-benzoquinol methylase [Proteobacteria bacterium]|nr:MAG: bifunctional demethylmenaquinone methyltransferase/2-methoxy-6-polyprenyl-1,4-benzoquinol methylase [Pseudomonadota bacterium]
MSETPEGPATKQRGATDFGFERVPEDDKAGLVAGVFDSVADRYDVMNDLMSAGLHRLWKRFLVARSGVRPGDRVLDVAGGTGDVTRLLAQRIGPGGTVILTDINAAMLLKGRDRLADAGQFSPIVRSNAESLPFASGSFDCVSIAFGLRNVTRKGQALSEMTRVLRPGGCLLVLEFSRVWAPLRQLYDAYSFGVLPKLGGLVVGDEASYRYLAESIRMHPAQGELKAMLEEAGLERVEYWNLAAGIVALHRGYRL